jgi:hypothetical protein
MWYKIEKSPNITLAYNYSNFAKRCEGEPIDYKSKDKAVYKNTAPVTNPQELPPEGGSGKFLVEGKWRFETIKQASAFAEEFLVPYQSIVRIAEKAVQVWGKKETEGSQVMLKRYANAATASRYATVIDTPENITEDVKVIYRNYIKSSSPPIIGKTGSFLVKLPSGTLLARYPTLRDAEAAAKKLTGYNEVWVCQS